MANQRVFRHFHGEELTNRIATLPNLMSLARAVGSPILGAMIATGKVDAVEATAWIAGLGATDAEGTTIAVARKFPRAQRLFRIFASKHGIVADIVADKIYAGSLLAAGVIADIVPEEAAIGIMAMEASTTIATGYTTNQGVRPKTPNVGKAGMWARVGTVVSYYAAPMFDAGSQMYENLQGLGHVSAATAVVLGGLSCLHVARQGRLGAAGPEQQVT